MGDWAQIFIQIDPPDPSVRHQMVDEVAQWLLEARIIAPFDSSKPGWHEEFGRSDWSPGPSWRDAVNEVDSGVFETLWRNGVDISPEVDYESALGNHEPWRCPRCAQELDESDYAESWVTTKIEPTASCNSCGYSARLGDWLCDFPEAVVGAPRIAFHNWHPLRAEIVDDLSARLGGGRCRYFWQNL